MFPATRFFRGAIATAGLSLVVALVGCTPTPPTPQATAPAAGTSAPAAAKSGSPATAPSPVVQTGSPAAPAAVKEQDLTFVPASITVAPGTTVVWTNTEAIPHTVTSGKPGGQDIGKLFDQNMPNQGETFSYTFKDPGVFDYFCRYHLPGMVGQVVVQEPGTAVKTGPTATPLPLPERFTTVGPKDTLPPPFNAKVAASGLDNPRGFAWGPDGALYVAESGISAAAPITGTASNEEQVRVLFCDGWKQSLDDPPPANCPQQDPQYIRSGRVSRIAPDGARSTVVDGLPVIVGMFGFSEGPQSVAFVGEDLYVLIVHALGKNRVDGFNTGVYRINPDKTGTLIAALDEYNREHPPQVVPPDYDLSEPHDMIALNRKLYVSDGNAGVIFEIDPSAPEGSRTRHIADLSGLDGDHPVLTGLSAGPDGNLYVTNLTKAPYPRGGAKVWQVSVPAGTVTEVSSGLTLGVGLAVAPDMTFYASEFARVIPRAPFFEPGGRVVKTTKGGPVEEVNSTLNQIFFPTIIRWGPDGDLYVTYFSIGGGPETNQGAIYRFDLPPFDS